MASEHVQSQFPVTRWTEIVQICQAEDETARCEALAAVCRDYWYPLYAFARRLGRSRHDAEDLTQGFFAYLLDRNVLASASRELGRLRTFLLTVLQRYIRDADTRENARKRGGGQIIVPLDLLNAEDRYRHEPADESTPESLFERAWALQVLKGAPDTLRQTETGESRARNFEILAPFLDPESAAAASTEEAARQLGMSAEGVRQSVSRLRKRFREALRNHISATLHEPGETQIDEELMALQAALRSP